jgi:putative transcriptional regulator
MGCVFARTSRAPSDMPPEHRITVHLDRLLEERGMTLTELAERVDVTVVNLSILKNGRARAVRFSTLTALCQVLNCQPGELLSYDPG